MGVFLYQSLQHALGAWLIILLLYCAFVVVSIVTLSAPLALIWTCDPAPEAAAPFLAYNVGSSYNIRWCPDLVIGSRDHITGFTNPCATLI